MNPQEQLWSGPKGDKYARRFFWTPAEVDAHWLKNYSNFPRAVIVKEALDTRVPKDASILEVGTNCGNQLQILKDMGYTDLSGTDINALAIQTMKNKRPWVGSVVAPTDRLPFFDKTFDMVMTCWTLCHMPPAKYLAAIKEIKRVTRKWVFISEPYSTRETETQKDYYWSRPVAADIGGEELYHLFVKAVGGLPVTTGVFLLGVGDAK